MPEAQFYPSGGPVAVLGDDYVGLLPGVFPVGMGRQPFFFGLVVIFVTIDKKDDVGVLLDTATLTEVGKLGLVGSAPFYGAAELGDGQRSRSGD